MPHETGFCAVILAAQRAGTIDPLAEAAGLSHKCVVPIGGAPMITHVVRALVETPGIARLRIVVEEDMHDPLGAMLVGLSPAPEYVTAADNLADSVFAAAQGVPGAIIVTTADNVLLSPAAVSRMAEAVRHDADVAIAMATEQSVKAAHPDGQRRFYRFSDNAYSNCNLYAFAGHDALRAAESFRSGGQFAKKKSRLIGAVGLVNVALMALGRLSLADALARLGRRFGLRIVPVVLADGRHAIDVDNERTYRVASSLMEQALRPLSGDGADKVNETLVA